jgi:hypothetical protein
MVPGSMSLSAGKVQHNGVDSHAFAGCIMMWGCTQHAPAAKFGVVYHCIDSGIYLKALC